MKNTILAGLGLILLAIRSSAFDIRFEGAAIADAEAGKSKVDFSRR